MTIAFANDKVVMPLPDRNTHLTLHFGTVSGVVDIHETTTRADGTKTHATLFTIPRANLARMSRALAPTILGTLRGMIRPLRPGWMVRQQVGAVLVGLSPNESELEAVTVKRKGKLLVVPEKLVARARMPEFVEELYDLADGESFTLFSWRTRHPRRVGTGFKVTSPRSFPRLVWVRDRDLVVAAHRLSQALRDVAGRYGTFHRPSPWL